MVEKTASKKIEKVTKEYFRVFVYGTLKRGWINNWRVFERIGAEFLCEDVLQDVTIMASNTPNKIPFIVRAPGKRVKGEIWGVEEKHRYQLNAFEYGYKPTLVVTESGIQCYAYFAPEKKTPYARKNDVVELGEEYLPEHFPLGYWADRQ